MANHLIMLNAKNNQDPTPGSPMLGLSVGPTLLLPCTCTSLYSFIIYPVNKFWANKKYSVVKGNRTPDINPKVSSKHKPAASEVLTLHLRQRNLPHWTSYFVYYQDVWNDQFGLSYFNWKVDGKNYQILRTGCYPFIKYHCSSRAYSDLTAENNLYTLLKLLNLGIPTLAYGLGSWFLIKYSEDVVMPDGNIIKVYFMNKEIPDAMY
ncbi:chromosome 15 open reading frame 61 [Plakobranchus ocellatus]|uniref:Chromosome 15 open reading frame 61 n=1 Tax=Plakobranchus ocellatus TaxID=259542 RepID=A0AAV4CQR8_9GAST|nr:chromosome 15 open reading frame 61 [Plakobranchus ocellatus]